MKHPKAHRIPCSDLMCESCAVPTVAGQAFTEYTCRDCQTEQRWPNTHTPVRCPECAKANQRCLHCEAAVPETGIIDIFVFGSNLAGRHGAGSAKFALTNHGAVLGQGVGLQGQSYAIPTKNRALRTLSLDKIQDYVNEFLEFAGQHPEMRFNIVEIGCGLAGYTVPDIAPMFSHIPSNCFLPDRFTWYLTKPASYAKVFGQSHDKDSLTD